MTAVLFKFCSGDSGVRILKGHSVFVTSPLDLNDPFEMRPGWTDNHEQRFAADQHLRSKLTAGSPACVVLANDMLHPIGRMPFLDPQPPTPVESHRGIADRHNSQIFRCLHLRFRILSLVSHLFDLSEGQGESDEQSALMWSHYADHFQGVCFALDPTRFDNGMRTGGFPVQYVAERKSLPASFYDCWRSLASPTCGTGHHFDPATNLYLTPGERSDSEKRHFLDLLVHKSPTWHYEHEIRMIYDLRTLVSSPFYRTITIPCEVCSRKERPAPECGHACYRDAIHLQPDAVRAVIFGADCPLQVVQRVFEVLSAEAYRHVETYLAGDN